MRIVNVLLSLVLGSALLFGAGSEAEEAEDSEITIEVTVTGARNTDGILLVAVADNGKDFPGNEAHVVKKMKVKIAKGATKFEIKGLKPGTYAITVHHDEDGDGKMKLRFGIIPREGVGASNNAKMKMGPPKWADAKFELGTEPLKQNITLNYL